MAWQQKSRVFCARLACHVQDCQLCACMQISGTCSLVGTKGGEPIADGIIAVAAKLDVDILVMGISGYGWVQPASWHKHTCVVVPCTTRSVLGCMTADYRFVLHSDQQASMACKEASLAYMHMPLFGLGANAHYSPSSHFHKAVMSWHVTPQNIRVSCSVAVQCHMQFDGSP